MKWGRAQVILTTYTKQTRSANNTSTIRACYLQTFIIGCELHIEDIYQYAQY